MTARDASGQEAYPPSTVAYRRKPPSPHCLAIAVLNYFNEGLIQQLLAKVHYR